MHGVKLVPRYQAEYQTHGKNNQFENDPFIAILAQDMLVKEVETKSAACLDVAWERQPQQETLPT